MANYRIRWDWVIDENVRVDVITFTRVTRVTRRTLVPLAVSLYWIRSETVDYNRPPACLKS